MIAAPYARKVVTDLECNNLYWRSRCATIPGVAHRRSRSVAAARIRPLLRPPTPAARHNDMRLTPIVAALLAAAACAPVDNTDPNLATPPPAAPAASAAPAPAPTKAAKPKLPAGTHQIVYKVAGSASKAMVTYSTPSGQEQQNGARLPWRRSFKAKDFSVLSVTAQNSGSGTITCEIDVDGKRVKASKSSGAYAVVSCDASLGF